MVRLCQSKELSRLFPLALVVWLGFFFDLALRCCLFEVSLLIGSLAFPGERGYWQGMRRERWSIIPLQAAVTPIDSDGKMPLLNHFLLSSVMSQRALPTSVHHLGPTDLCSTAVADGILRLCFGLQSCCLNICYFPPLSPSHTQAWCWLGSLWQPPVQASSRPHKVSFGRRIQTVQWELMSSDLQTLVQVTPAGGNYPPHSFEAKLTGSNFAAWMFNYT